MSKKNWSERGSKAKKEEEKFLEKQTYLSKSNFEVDTKKLSVEIRTIKNQAENTLHEDQSENTLYENYVRDTITSIILTKEFFKKNKLFEKIREDSTIRLFKFDGKSEKESIQLPIQVDMTKIIPRGKELNSHIDQCNGKVISIIDAIEESEVARYYFIYVVQRYDGMVTVVGKTSFAKNDKRGGDLYKKLDLDGKFGTENIILRMIIGNEVADEINKTLTSYYKRAWIVPIYVSVDKTKKEGDSYVETFEKVLGESLIEKKVPILNYYSHTKGHG